MVWFYCPFNLNKDLRIIIPEYFNVIICIDGYTEFYKIKNKWYTTSSRILKKLSFENYVKRYCINVEGVEFPVYNYEKYNIV